MGSSSSDEESDISDSEINEYKEKPYELLKAGRYRVKGPNGSLRCPFCAGKKKQDYLYNHLYQHAIGASKATANTSAKQKANHLALAMFLETDPTLAREDDYKSEGPVGDYLRRTGQFKTISVLEQESKKDRDKIVGLVNELDLKSEHMDQLQIKQNEINLALSGVLEEKDELHRPFIEEMRKLQRINSERIKTIMDERKKGYLELESKRKRLDSWRKEVNEREASTERERQKLEEEKAKNDRRNNALQLASVEQRKADENLLRQLEEQKRVKEEARKKDLELKRNLDETEKLAMEKLVVEITELKRKLEVTKYLVDNDDAAVQQKINEMKEQLQEKNEDLEGLQDLYTQLLSKVRKNYDELQEAREELIEAFRDIPNSSRASIGIKRMGEIGEKAFKNACKKILPSDDIKALELCSLWQEKLKNPEWHPFRVVEDSRGNTQNVVKEDDELLVCLKEEWGEEVFDVVAKALNEIQEYNPSRCNVVSELWNFKENRKATLKEVIAYIFNQRRASAREHEHVILFMVVGETG